MKDPFYTIILFVFKLVNTDIWSTASKTRSHELPLQYGYFVGSYMDAWVSAWVWAKKSQRQKLLHMEVAKYSADGPEWLSEPLSPFASHLTCMYYQTT